MAITVYDILFLSDAADLDDYERRKDHQMTKQNDTNPDAQPDAADCQCKHGESCPVCNAEFAALEQLVQATERTQPDAAPDNKKEVFRVFWTDAKHPEPTMVLLRFRSEFRANLCAEQIAMGSPGVKVWVEKETAPDEEQEADNVL